MQKDPASAWVVDAKDDAGQPTAARNTTTGEVVSVVPGGFEDAAADLDL
jgi:hypothetical protein